MTTTPEERARELKYEAERLAECLIAVLASVYSQKKSFAHPGDDVSAQVTEIILETFAEIRRAEQLLLAQVAKALREFPLGHNHWDDTMSHGVGCELCQRQLAAKQELSKLITEAPSNVLTSVQAEARLAALEEAADVGSAAAQAFIDDLDDKQILRAEDCAEKVATAIHALAQAAAPAKET